MRAFTEDEIIELANEEFGEYVTTLQNADEELDITAQQWCDLELDSHKLGFIEGANKVIELLKESIHREAAILITPDNEESSSIVETNGVSNFEMVDILNGLIKAFAQKIVSNASKDIDSNDPEEIAKYINFLRNNDLDKL